MNISADNYASNAHKTCLLQHIGLLIKSKLWDIIVFDFYSIAPPNMLAPILYDL